MKIITKIQIDFSENVQKMVSNANWYIDIKQSESYHKLRHQIYDIRCHMKTIKPKKEEECNMAKIYYDDDANLELVTEKVVAIIGYGNQGRAQALNMRDSGVKRVIVGSREDGSYDQAVKDGFEVFPIDEACKKADIIFMLLPDEYAPKIFEEKIAPGLEEGNIINFASAYNITFHKIVPPKFVDVVMAAPRMIGEGVRDLYLRGEGSPAFVGVAQDARCV